MSGDFRRAARAAAKCSSCGACMSVCPVFKAGHQEGLVARGKLSLLCGLGAGLISPDKELLATMSQCLLCGRCQQNCPNQVESTLGIEAGRAALADEVGMPLVKKLFMEKVLPTNRRLGPLARAGRLLKPLANAAIPVLSGLNLRFPALNHLRRLPTPAVRPYLSSAPLAEAGPKNGPRFGFFVGCVANYLKPELAKKAVSLLARVGQVIIPPWQGCCGLPALSAGLPAVSGASAQETLAAFAAAGVDRIVTTCGSCAHTIASVWSRSAASPAEASLCEGVLEISQVLAEEPQVLARLGGSQKTVAVHDPCHLKVGLGVSQEPRRMLESAGVELVEMAGADQCCGGGGLFAVNEPDLSQKIFAPRAQAFAACGAAVLATSCSGCFLQWRSGLDDSIDVVHPLELIGRGV